MKIYVDTKVIADLTLFIVNISLDKH